jgi:hypothetical protein
MEPLTHPSGVKIKVLKVVLGGGRHHVLTTSILSLLHPH